MIGTDQPTLGRYEVIRLLSFYLLYLYMAITFRPGDLKLIVGALLLGVLGQLPFAVLEYVKPGFTPQIFGQVSSVKEELVGATGASVSRVSGTLTHPNELGSYLILMLPLTMLIALAKPAGSGLRLIAWLAFIGGLGMLALTFSRASWVGAALGLPLALILAAAFRQIPAGQVVFLLVLGLVTATVVVLSPPVLDRLLESDPLNVTFRFQIAQVAYNMWQSQPVTGVGLNSFVEHARAFDVDHIAILSSGGGGAAASVQSLPVHNVYLLVLAETGVIGAVGWLTYLVWAGGRCFKAMTSRIPLGPIFAIGFLAGGVALYIGDIASFTSRIDPVMQAFLMMLGVAVAIGLKRKGAPAYANG
jgi:O-antigen ligase